MKKLVLCLLVLFTGISACKKEKSVDPYKQLEADENLIKEFAAKNNLTLQRHESGVYYVISEPGTGDLTYSANTKVTVNYTGRLLNGQQFDKNDEEISFYLGQVIVGWQYGVPLIKKGGKIRLLIPSGYAYGPNTNGSIPANSILDFDIELLDAMNN